VLIGQVTDNWRATVASTKQTKILNDAVIDLYTSPEIALLLSQPRKQLLYVIKECKQYVSQELDKSGLTGDAYVNLFKQMDEQTMTVVAITAAWQVAKHKLTVAQVKDAAWEGFNGLLEASCVTQNVQHFLGLTVDKINPNDFIIFPGV
jgi:hypothetical protein